MEKARLLKFRMEAEVHPGVDRKEREESDPHLGAGRVGVRDTGLMVIDETGIVATTEAEREAGVEEIIVTVVATGGTTDTPPLDTALGAREREMRRTTLRHS
jgi:hypothetical protein